MDENASDRTQDLGTFLLLPFILLGLQRLPSCVCRIARLVARFRAPLPPAYQVLRLFDPPFLIVFSPSIYFVFSFHIHFFRRRRIL